VKIPGIQLKLTGALAGLVVLVVLVWGVVAERGIRRAELERVSRSLEQRAALLGELVRDIPFEDDRRAALDAVADRAASGAEVRVTLIGPDGALLGDSDVPLARLPGVENHADRPEVRAALEGRVGSNTRRSATVGRDLLYLAIPHEGGGVVRVAVDLSDLEAAVAHLRRVLALAGAAGLCAALVLAYAFSWLTLRPIREMRRVAASIAGGRLDDRLPLGSGDELADLGHAINQMAEQLRLRLEEVTHEKEQLRAVLEGMVEGVLVVDTKGTVLLANHRLREFYGASADIAGRPLLDSIRDAELDAVVARASQTDEVVTHELTVDGARPRILSVYAARFPSGGARRVGTVAVFHDVTELMRLENVRRDFVANASHELRTPLAAIRGFAETLLGNGGLAETDRRAYLEVIDRHAQRLGNIVSDLLELSKIESRKSRLTPQVLDASEVARELVQDWEPRIRDRRIHVAVHGEGDTDVWADRQALEQVLSNLLDNALKYSEAEAEVEILVRGADGRVCIQVRDTGIGIPNDDLARIFERFYRVDKARSRALGGTGLGLSIVKHLVQRMDGSVRVESALGAGSTFSVDLPAPADAQAPPRPLPSR
jgi:two-component system phosphate regulon sensor histidine kinase PhoR